MREKERTCEVNGVRIQVTLQPTVSQSVRPPVCLSILPSSPLRDS